MSTSPSLRLPMIEASQPGEARRIALEMAARLGFDEVERGKVAIVATEIGRNLVLHAQGGELLVRVSDGAHPAIELLAIDRGPGMASVGDCLRDGFSTAGTAGVGLGAIARTASSWDVFSMPGKGTVLVARLQPDPGKPKDAEIGPVCVPAPGEEASGDAWAVHDGAGRKLLCVVDGLGHGPRAAEAARQAIGAFQRHGHLGPASLIDAVHLVLRSTRGAAVGIAEVTPGSVRFAGVGNIAATVSNGEKSSSLISHSGIVGHQMRKVQEFTCDWEPGALLLSTRTASLRAGGSISIPASASATPALSPGFCTGTSPVGAMTPPFWFCVPPHADPMSTPILRTEIRTEQDVILTRPRARQIAELLGFETLDQTRIATAVSEIARNAFRYAGGGRVEFGVQGGSSPAMTIQIRDEGPGIPHLDQVLGGDYRSTTGMGIGILGAQRLMEGFHIQSTPGRGTQVSMRKPFPQGSSGVGHALIQHVAQGLAQAPPQNPLAEAELQNRELLRALAEVRLALEENERLREELSETNRGVMALYAELDEKARDLQRASELKSRFLSHMSHEFRTPLNSILSLSRFLLDRMDGPLTAEQEKQVCLIRQSAENLYELVNDLLDLAKIEAGKIPLRPADFTAGELFATLRGMFRPLVQAEGPSLVFQEPEGLPSLYADEGRVSQILRNFISNALKFTEQGEVRVWAERGPDSTLRFSVRDTGIGIAPDDQLRIFEEFTQVESAVQRRVRGTGLGLSLSRKLAELLGGSIELESALGTGSTFTLVLPARAASTPEPPEEEPAAAVPLTVAPSADGGGSRTALLIDDDEGARYVLRQLLTPLGCRVVEASHGQEGLSRAAEEAPDVIFLDLVMPGQDGFRVLTSLKEHPGLARIPVVVFTSRALTEIDRRKLGSAAAILSKHMPSEEASRGAVRQALVRAGLSHWIEETAHV